MARVHTFRVLDRDYPYLLRDLSHPPDPVLVHGELLPAPAVAIVGTRTPSDEALTYAHRLAFRLARRGVTVWSGGAVGIDAAAHVGALDAGGRTIAVVPTGLDHCYPTKHAALYAEIVVAGGALVSPFERAREAARPNFFQRNAVLAALTQATVVVQARLKSGARSTASHARRLRRPLFVVPGWPWEELADGNVAELALGATPLAAEAQLFKLLGVPLLLGSGEELEGAPRARASAPAAKAHANEGVDPAPICIDAVIRGLSDPHRAVLEATRNAPRHVDELCAETGQPAALVQSALLTLTLEAVLVEGPAGWFRRSSVRKD